MNNVVAIRIGFYEALFEYETDGIVSGEEPACQSKIASKLGKCRLWPRFTHHFYLTADFFIRCQ